MSSSSSSNITILNRTAFPLNVALSILAPFQHINALEPGDVWTTESPSFLPLPSNDNFPRRAVKALSPLLLSRSKWLKRLPIKPKVSIDIRFDHEHNRYSEEEAYHLWTSFSARWLGLIALSGAFVTIVSSQVIGIVSPSSSRRIPASCLALGVFGVLCLIVSFYGVYNLTEFLLTFTRLLQNVGKHAKIKTQLSRRVEYYQQQSLRTLSTVQHLPHHPPPVATQTLPYCGYVAASPSGI
ncbi:hypothetical protein PC9H_007946 [Pleurotus ostreatus]|uniref:Uncharacterized protein n=1 Tax=Pleurotus ostreatus TaxID=5322 RepID=A0A8H7DS10_PLEOS|nr:uncharacterized protein PC9H_007946 [Pleurotus ostreatus]KAF7428717.1 hypothetical protein PC9H_007946 [Pleurotus ostreatus]